MAEGKSCSMGNKVDHTSDQPCEVSYQYIKEITKDYDEGLIVGNGAFGTVYKGICKNGEEIAIKVLKNMSGIDNKEFQLEFENLRRLKHQNVVKLVGFCNEPEKVLVEHNGNQVVADKMHTALCFEYVHNGSLAKHIPDVGCSGLNWHMLYKIIKGFCQGLEYLRHGLEFSVWHLDLKPANILLDNNMIPKIADFGLSRLLGDENTRKTISSVGTRGYLPPEYIERGLITKEFDIFSLGVIIAKLMAGREDYSKIDSMTEKRFIKLVHENWRRKLCETLAPRQLEVYCEQVKICIRIAVQCMSRNRQERPTIQSIVTNLTRTEKFIGKPGLQREQFRLGEPSLREGSIYSTSPEMVAEATRGKTEKGKASTVSTEKEESPLQLLKKITNDFSDERIIGQDSLGILYKGILEDGEVIAVKKLAAHSRGHYNSSFIHEMENMMAVKHENTVQMVGFCREKHKKVVENNGSYITADVVEGLLCYEYLPKGSLRKNLFEESSSTDWETCFKIIKGICQGLHFLHSMPIGHVNLRTENIYLDNKMRPKIAGFGYSRLIGSGNEPVHQLIRTGRKGRKGRTSRTSSGYMAPEYLYRGESSDWSDIYSLGVLIIKISTRERNCDNIDQISERTSFESVRKTWTDEYIMSKYPSLHEGCLKQISACIQIGLRCVEFDRYKRPSMQNIVDRLHEISNIGSNSFLCLQSPHINFPIGPKRLTYSSVYLMNSTDDHIAFRLGTKIPRRYLTKLPFCGIVPPNCTYTLNVIMHKQKRPPPLDSDDSLTLQESIARRGNLDNVDPASVALFLDTAGDKVREVKVGVACEPLAETISNQIIDAQNYRELLSIDVHPTEPWILTSNQRGYVCIWNYQTQAEVNSVEVTREPVYSAKFIEREEWFVVGSGDGCIYVYNYNTMEEVDMIEAHDIHCIMCLAVNPTHSFVLSASDDHKIKLWDWTNEWQCTRTFDGHYGTVTQVMFNPRNSESFSSASLDHTVKIWNIRSETCNITWEGHPEGLLCLHYHPRYFQQFLISGSSDGAVKVWDLETDTCVDTLQGHREGLGALCWHPELRVIVTGSLDGTVQIWKSTSTTYRLENIIGLNLGAVNALGYLKGLTSWLKFSFLETGCLKFHSFSFLFFGPPVHLSTRRVTKAQDRTSATENPPSIAISRVLVVSYDKPPLFQQEASHLFADLPAGQRRERSGAAAMARPSRLYLIAYNSLQSLGWSLALFRLLACLAPPVSLHPAYALAGDLICFLQTCAVLETVHAAVGLVPTSPFLAFLQWGGRTHFVLALLRQIPEIQGSPSVFITFMAWSISEVIRYSHYALTSLKVCPAWLTYLRYTAFIPLYPIGVGPGEMWTIYQALPFVKERDLYSAFFAKFSISYHSFLVGGLLCYPLLWLKLYLHVFKQRKSKLGKADRKKKRA